MWRAQLPSPQASLVSLQPLLPPPLPSQSVQTPHRSPQGRTLQVYETPAHVHVQR